MVFLLSLSLVNSHFFAPCRLLPHKQDKLAGLEGFETNGACGMIFNSRQVRFPPGFAP